METEERKCDRCGAVHYVTVWRCRQCERWVERGMEYGDGPPLGWILVRETTDLPNHAAPAYCSWACVRAHAEGVELAR